MQPIQESLDAQIGIALGQLAALEERVKKLEDRAAGRIDIEVLEDIYRDCGDSIWGNRSVFVPCEINPQDTLIVTCECQELPSPTIKTAPCRSY